MKLQTLLTVSMDIEADHDVIFIHRVKPDGRMVLYKTLECPPTIGMVWCSMLRGYIAMEEDIIKAMEQLAAPGG